MENLSELATIYANVKILHFHVDVKNNRLDFKVVHVACLLPRWIELLFLAFLFILIYIVSFN